MREEIEMSEYIETGETKEEERASQPARQTARIGHPVRK